MATQELRISNVNVFDSVGARITGPMDVTVRGGLVASVAPTGSTEFSGAKIDGTGKTLLPGLIDAHWHAVFATTPAVMTRLSEVGYVFARAVVSAQATVMRGFTTVRDLGGSVFGIKQAIDDGSIVGPRIFPAGGVIPQSGGHGDFRLPNEVPRGVAGHLSYSQIIGAAVIADGEAEVLQQATIRNAELLAMSGPRNPYPGRLGVMAEGAFADLILVDGDPVTDISLIARPDETFTAIIKDGRLVKGTAES